MARLNIILSDDLYRRLKRELPVKRISAFIEDAVRGRLRPDRRTLDAAYRAARKERSGDPVVADWEATEAETWPE